MVFRQINIFLKLTGESEVLVKPIMLQRFKIHQKFVKQKLEIVFSALHFPLEGQTIGQSCKSHVTKIFNNKNILEMVWLELLVQLTIDSVLRYW